MKIRNIKNRYENYWLQKAKILKWEKFPNKIFLRKKHSVHWFSDGKINLFNNCILKNILNGLGNKTAVIYLNENKEISRFTYNDLLYEINRFCAFLENIKSIRKIDKIMIHASASIDTSIAMLSCARLGIHFCVIFKELEIEAIKKRIKLFDPDLFVTENKVNFFSKKINKKILIRNLFQYKKNKGSSDESYKAFEGDKDLFTLFTSGSTGMPKGIVHSTAGYMTFITHGCKEKFGINKKSIILTASDAGWINGHTYAIFGPLFFGATTVLLKSPMLLIDSNIVRKVLSLKISIFYLPVTLIKLMRQLYSNYSFKNTNNMTLGSMGEPLAPDIAKWFVKTFGKSNQSIVNTYFQTETSGIISSHKYNQKIKNKFYGSVGKPFSKYIKFEKIDKKKKYELKMLYPWPGQMKRILNGANQWNKYFDNKNNFRLFDLATINKGHIFIHGRTDDVINIRGHRIGSGEIEAVILKCEDVIEAAAVAVNDYLEGFNLYVFVATKNKNKELLERKLVKIIHENFGSYAIPKKIIFLKELPRTRSGKILRRLLRDILENKNYKFKDLSTLLNKVTIKEIYKEVDKFL